MSEERFNQLENMITVVNFDDATINIIVSL